MQKKYLCDQPGSLVRRLTLFYRTPFAGWWKTEQKEIEAFLNPNETDYSLAAIFRRKSRMDLFLRYTEGIWEAEH